MSQGKHASPEPELPEPARPPVGGGLASVAARGSTWGTAQATVNKAATAASMLLVACFLSPTQMGVATLAIAVSGFLVPFPPIVMGDVLVGLETTDARPRRLAARIAMRHAIAMAALSLALAWPIAAAYPDAPTLLLAMLIGLLGAKPLAEALSIGSLTRLRVAFSYRAIAIADGATQLAATAATAVMAVAGAGPLAIVLPQAVGFFAKAAWYRVAANRLPTEARDDADPQERRGDAGRLAKSFRTAATAQYVHNLVFAIAPPLLGLLSDAEATGYYAFAFMLATQATVVIGSQLVVVLQPVLSRLNGDPNRQSEAYARVITVLCAIAVPVSLLQVAFAEPLFALLFRPKWDGAFLPFLVLSVSQSFYVVVSPTIALMKARARFGTFLCWQGAHLLIAALCYSAGAHWGGALGVAIADLAVWAVSAPAAMFLSTRGTTVGAWRCFRALIAPCAASVPLAIASGAAAHQLTAVGSAGALAALLLAAPIAAVFALAATKWTQPAAWEEAKPLLARLSARFRGR